MAAIGHAVEIFYNTIIIGLGHNDAGYVAGRKLGLQIVLIGAPLLFGKHDRLHAVELGIRAHHAQNGRRQRGRQKHLVALPGSRHRHEHGLGRGRGAVVHTCIREVHSRQLGHHRLIFEDILQRALGNLSLIGGIRRQKLGTRGYVGHYGRRVVVVGPAAGKARERTVGGRKLLELAAYFHLALGLGDVQWMVRQELAGHLGIELVQRRHSDNLQHRPDVVVGMGKIFI